MRAVLRCLVYTIYKRRKPANEAPLGPTSTGHHTIAPGAGGGDNLFTVLHLGVPTALSLFEASVASFQADFLGSLHLLRDW